MQAKIKEPRITYLGRDITPRVRAVAIPRKVDGTFTFKSAWHRFKAWLWKWTVRVMWTLVFLAVLSVAAFIGYAEHGNELPAVVNKVEVAAQEAPVLARISDCESGNGKTGTGHQFNSDGTVVRHMNANGSIDVGKYEINLSSEHVAEMSKMGLNPLTEAGNAAYAKFLYENRGTGDWSASAHCWMR